MGGACVLAGCLAAAAVTGAAPAALGSTASLSTTQGYQDQLFGVAALSPSNTWAVGLHCPVKYERGALPESSTPLIEHWTGHAWSRAVISGSGSAQGGLEAVSADSPHDIWAVGHKAIAASPYETSLIMHWNGTAWSVMHSGFAGASLYGVSALSPTDVWAVGYEDNMVKPSETLTLHWNGSTWSRIPCPSPGYQSAGYLQMLNSVTALSADDAWAVGYYETVSQPNGVRLIVHWNGTKWSKVANPKPDSVGSQLNGVSALSATSLWTVGSFCTDSPEQCSPFDQYALAMRGNGTRWTDTVVPNPGGSNEYLGVAARTSSDAWAVGDDTTGDLRSPDEALIAHWDGIGWARVTSPEPSASYNLLYGVSADAANDAWAVGYYSSPRAPATEAPTTGLPCTGTGRPGRRPEPLTT